MTKELKTLIKLHKQYLDEKRRELVEFEKLREAQINLIKNSEKQIELEKKYAEQSPDKSYTFHHFLQKERHLQREAARKVELLSKEVDRIAGEISEAFTDLKKYEILKEIKDEQALKEEMRKLQIDLDEIGAVSHQRKETSA